MAAAEVAKSAKIGVIILVKLIASNGLESLEITIVLPGKMYVFDPKRDLWTS